FLQLQIKSSDGRRKANGDVTHRTKGARPGPRTPGSMRPFSLAPQSAARRPEIQSRWERAGWKGDRLINTPPAPGRTWMNGRFGHPDPSAIRKRVGGAYLSSSFGQLIMPVMGSSPLSATATFSRKRLPSRVTSYSRKIL